MDGDKVTEIWVNPPHERAGKARDTTVTSLGFLFRGFRFNFVRVYVDKGGRYRLGFPDRMPFETCSRCDGRIPMLHHYCHYCGLKQPKRKLGFDQKGRTFRYRPLVYPFSAAELAKVERVVLAAWQEALASGVTSPAMAPNGVAR